MCMHFLALFKTNKTRRKFCLHFLALLKTMKPGMAHYLFKERTLSLAVQTFILNNFVLLHI